MPPEAPVMSVVCAFTFVTVQPRIARRRRLCACQRRLYFIDRVPGSRGLQLTVDIIDVLYPFRLQPRTERRRPLLRIDRNPILPSRASAQHSVELHTGLPRQLQGLAEFRVADSG